MANFDGKYPYNVAQGGEIDNYMGSTPPNTYYAKTMPVGSYAPNNYGLYDMHGNVFEWCSDWFNVDYSQSGIAINDIYTDPTGPDTGSFHVFRGSGWNYYAQFSRSAYRNRGNPDRKDNDLGFRVVFVP